MEFEVALGTAADVDQLRGLWLQMLSHHREVVGGDFPIRSADRSWELTQRDYRDWLADRTAILLIARSRGSPEPLGYAVCRLLASGATFDLGAVRGEVHSLVVDDQTRGQGIGSALLEAIRVTLVDRGVSYWSIGVLAHNPEAARLYRQAGFAPWTQELLASTSHP